MPQQSSRKILKLLNEGTRIELIEILYKKKQQTLSELGTQLNQPEAFVSRNIAPLRGARVILDELHNGKVMFKMNPDMPVWLLGLLDDLAYENKL